MKENKNQLWYNCPVCGVLVFAEFHDIVRKCKCGCHFNITLGWKELPPKQKDTNFINTQ